MNDASPRTSIIIRTFNEERFIGALLESISRQDCDDFEVVVVDSGSFDRTTPIVRDHGVRLVEIASRDFTFGFSLNQGIRASSGRNIVMVSAHTLPVDQNWLSSLIEPLSDERTAMVYGRQMGNNNSNYAELLDFERTFGDRHRKGDFFANNANSAIRRDLWEQEPFDESLPGLEDIAWAKHWVQKGYRVVYRPEAALYHIHQETWPQVRRRYYREAVAARAIGIKSKRTVAAESLREAAWYAEDLLQAAAKGDLFRKFTELTRFRLNKALGTIKGLLDGRALEDARQKQPYFFNRGSRAVVIKGPGHAVFERVELPAIKPSEVCVRVVYQGVCGTDLEIFSGELGFYKNGVTDYPIVPGHEFSGRVVETGPNVQDFSKGDAVVVECIQACGECAACRRGNWVACAERKELGVLNLDGGYSEFVVTPARYLHKIPPGVDMKTAALAEPTAVATKGTGRLSQAMGNSSLPKICAVVGAGTIGNLCAQILKLKGFEVTVFDRNPKRLKAAGQAGLETADSLERLERYSVIVEATGDLEALKAILEYSPPGATLLLLGLPYARCEVDFEQIVSYDKTIVGSVGSSKEDYRQALEILPKLKLDSFRDKVLPLTDYQEAWRLFRKGDHLKVLLDCNLGADDDVSPEKA